MKQPKGFEIDDKKDYIRKLNKYFMEGNNLQENGTNDLMSLLLELVLNVASMILALTSSS